MVQCKAKSKQSGERCRRHAMKVKEVCHIHGGKTPGGIASPHFRDGRYSKYMPKDIRGRARRAANDPDLLALYDDIAAIDARLTQCFERLDKAEGSDYRSKLLNVWATYLAALAKVDVDAMRESLNAVGGLIQRGASEASQWREIVYLMDNRRRLVESERKRLVEMQQIMTAEEVMALVRGIAMLIREHVHDRNALAAISDGIAGLIAVGAAEMAING